MTDEALPRPPSRGRRLGWLLVAVVAVVVAIPVTIFVMVATSCGCATPPSDGAAIGAARDYVGGVADGTIDVSDPERAKVLADLDDPATVWTVVHTRRPDGTDGDSPAVRVIAGLSPVGTWDALVVRTESDYTDGEVDPDVHHLDDSRPEVIRGGATPLFESGSGGDGDDYTTSPALLATGQEPIELAAIENSMTLVYTGEGLAPGRYLVIEGGENMADDPPRAFVTASWFEVPAPSSR